VSDQLSDQVNGDSQKVRRVAPRLDVKSGRLLRGGKGSPCSEAASVVARFLLLPHGNQFGTFFFVLWQVAGEGDSLHHYCSYHPN
jgi:hypothetical protein